MGRKKIKSFTSIIRRLFESSASYLNKILRKAKRSWRANTISYRLALGFMAVLLLFVLLTDTFRFKDLSDKYNIASIESLLIEEPVELYAQKLVPQADGVSLVYNEDYTPGADVAGQSYVPKFSAKFNVDGDDAVEVIDSVNSVGFKITPMFALHDPIKNKNRVVQPIVGKDATKVFTLKGSAIKEDLILFREQGDALEFDYKLELPSGTEARIESDGSIGVYGVSPELLGNVSVGSEQDQQLLDRLRENGQKNKILFRIPAPFIVERNQKVSKTARAWFSMPDTKTLRVHAANLKDAKYPLSIDPSVYIETARKLMRGNSETNIDFDVTNELIQKGSTTGARFDSWDDTTQLNDGRWNGASAVAGGFIYYAGGATEGGLVQNFFSTPGSTNYVVPAGVTSVTIKLWGAGGGGGGASADRAGGAGGGGGYAGSTISVTPGETLSVRVGGGGGGGTGNGTGTNSGNGGGGGGYSGVFRSTTPLIVAAGGGGGGGGNGDTSSTARQAGSPGGAGGGTTGVAGTGNGTTTGGGGGTQAAGGTAGTVGGVAGASLAGGGGGSNGGRQANGGTNGGGQGGTQQNGGGPNKKPGGGGGGAGYFGGGGGGLANAQYNGGGGAGGGSSYTTGSPATNAAGVGQDPGNKNDGDRSGAGDGGSGGTAGATGAAGDNGYVVISYSTGGAGAVQEEVFWAQLDETTGAISSPNPGDGTCVNWCTDPDYNLPDERQGHTMVSYNGFLYVLGGVNDGGTRQTTVYIAKLGANGEPQLWHPTDDNQNNWVYWYSGTALSSARSYHSAVAYNNRLYLLGGSTSGSPGGVTTVEYADISPTGELGSWSSTGMTALPSARFGHTVEIYNGYMYLIGGNSSGTLQNSIHYNKLNTDGSMNTWYTTETFTGARMTWGGDFTTVWGGYLYLHGGCSAVSGTTGYCNTVEQDTQLASINADGTVTDWNTIEGLNNLRIGHSIEAWRDAIYGIGGCNSQNPIDGQCADLILTNDYGQINQDGDASTVSDSVDIGTGTCTGADPYDCDTPPLGNGDGQGGQMAGGLVINNGYVYYIGGCRVVGGSNQICTNGAASRTADTIYYAQIANDGTLRRPATCTGTGRTYAGSWCVDNFNTINGSTGLAAFGYTVFNNTIYAIGGTDGATWQTNVYYTTLNADGTLNAWSSQTQNNVGLGTASLGYPYVFARANPSTASTFPGNLYVIGGCNGTGAGIDCNNTFFTTVYKCKISTTGALGTGADACTTTGQVQIDAEPSTGGNQGLGIMAGAVYANYIYLIGGQSPGQEERGQVMYARIDNSNNIVDVDGETVNDNIWETSNNSINPARRRGIAFGYNGYLYALAGFAVDTGLNDLLFAKIDVSNGSIGAFAVSDVTVNQRWDLRGVVSSGYVYTLGGCGSGAPPATCNSMTDTIQTFQLYNNFSGSTSDYVSSANDFATDRIGGSAAVLNGYLYIAGGCTSATNCTTTTTSVQYAQLAMDGSIGTWSAATNGLPAARAWGQLEVVGGYLYYLGGQSGADTTAQSTVYYAQPSSGNITSAWSTATGGIGDTVSQAAQTLTEFGATVWDNRIYVIGGFTGTAVSNAVYISPDLTNGGNIAADSWVSDTDTFNVARRGHTVMSYAGNLYVFGGFDGTNYLNDSQYASIGYKTGTIAQSGTTLTGTGTSWTSAMVGSIIQYPDGSRATITAYTSGTSLTVDSSKTVTAGTSYVIQDGSVGSWSYTTSLPERIRNADGIARNGYIYLFGGRSAANTCTDNTYITPISANTTVASGNNPTGVGEWYQTREDLDGADRYGAAAAYNEGKVYILGGGCGATLTYTGNDRTLYATLFSQPQVARYSRMIDTDTDVFPTKWLMNGIDNDVGARWVLSYRSSTDSSNSWGQNTNFGTVTLGDVEDYIPRDGAGVDTEFARFYYFSISIDSSQAYGYPDDVTRGPTINDLTLFFTSDPNKRLRHGKTFTGGEKQPLDTPPGN